MELIKFIEMYEKMFDLKEKRHEIEKEQGYCTRDWNKMTNEILKLYVEINDLKMKCKKKDNEISISKEVILECAHKLPNHKGKCKNLHGHSYKVVLTFKAEPDKETGMVMDFSDVPTKLLEEKYDHQYLNNFMENPTAENFIIEIHRFLKKKGYSPNIIEVWETAKCKAFKTFMENE